MLTKTRTRNAEEILAAAEADRLTRDADADRNVRQAEERLRLTREQAQQRRDDRRTEREEKRADRDARRARRVAARKAFTGAVRRHFPRVAIAVLAGIPIAAPMAVAWTGQVQTAVRVLHWPTAAGIVFAAAWESVGILAAVLHHLTRSAGDRGTVFRFAAWACATGAAAMNYGDRTDHWQPTALGMSYGAMSLVSLAVWELVALFLHRRAQQANGRVSPPRPHFGLLRWLRFSRLTWTAWSLSLRDDIGTVRAALDAASEEITKADTAKEVKRNSKAAITSGHDSANEVATGSVAEQGARESVGAVEIASVDSNEHDGTAANEIPSTAVRKRPRKRTRKAPPKAARKLLADYVAAARLALVPDVDPTPAWVRDVTGCSRPTAAKVIVELQATAEPVTEDVTA